MKAIVVTDQAAGTAGMAGAYVIGTGRAADRQTVLDFGAQEFVDLENTLEDVGEVEHAFDKRGLSFPKSAVQVRPVGLRSKAVLYSDRAVKTLRGISRSSLSHRNAFEDAIGCRRQARA